MTIGTFLFLIETRRLHHSEAFGAFAGGEHERSFKLLVALVVGQAKLVEARVCRWQISKRGCRSDLEPRIQLLKTSRRQLRTSGGELQQSGHFRLRKVSNGRPEPAQNPPELGRSSVDDVIRSEVRDRVLSGAAE